MSNKVAQFQEIRETQEKISGFVVGTLEELDAQGRLSVSWQTKNGDVNRQVVSSMRSMDESLDANDVGRKVILGFENADPQYPILFGFLNDTPAKETVELTPGSQEVAELPESLHLKSEQELILECGKAKISLRADGRIVILGGYVVSRSTGVNKIKGGSVQIN